MLDKYVRGCSEPFRGDVGRCLVEKRTDSNGKLYLEKTQKSNTIQTDPIALYQHSLFDDQGVEIDAAGRGFQFLVCCIFCVPARGLASGQLRPRSRQ